MAIKSLEDLGDYELVNSSQDCRGWPVVDATGIQIGAVSEMLVDTDRDRVTAFVLTSGEQIPAQSVSLKDGKVLAGAGAAVTTGIRADTMGTEAHEVSDGELVLPVVEEEIRVGKREVDRVGLRVSTRVEERPVEESVRLREEHINVERRAVDRPVAAADSAAFREGAVEVHAQGQEAVVSKNARVVEEVVIAKTQSEREQTVRDTVKRTDVDVENFDADREKKAR